MKKVIRYIIYAILFSAIIFGFIYIGKYDFKMKNNKANELIASKFKSLDKNNKYQEVNIDEAIDIIKNDGLLLIANPNNKWADKYAAILNEAAYQTDIKNIALIDITVDRAQNNRKYKKLLSALDDYVIYDDLGDKTIYMPTFIIVKDNKIIFIDNDTALHLGKDTLDNYWTSEMVNNKKSQLIDMINDYIRDESHE